MGAGNAVRKHLERQLGDPYRIEPEHEGEERLAHAGTHDLAGDRQIHGVREHARGVIGKHLAPQHHDLRALRHDAERGRNRPRTISRSGRERRTTQRPGRRSSKAPSYGVWAASSVANR